MKKNRMKVSQIILIGVLIFSMIGVYAIHHSLSFAEPLDEEQTEETTPGDEEELPPWQPEEELPSWQPEEETSTPSVSQERTETAPETTSNQNGNDEPGAEDVSEATIDTRLWGLSISCGSLVPEFSSDIYEYTVYVNKDQENKSCEIIAEPVDDAAEIRIEGPDTFSDEDVERKITLTGTAGEKTEYVIKVHIVTATELLKDNRLYVMTEKPDLKQLPDGFSEQKITYRGEKITVARSKDGNLVMVQYVDASKKDDVLWYRLDTESEKLYPAKVVKINGQNSIVIAESKDFVYGKSEQGTGYYVYHPEKKTAEFILAENLPAVKQTGLSATVKVMMGLLVGITLLSVAAVVVLYGRCKKQMKNAKNGSKYFRPYISLAENEPIQDKKEE